VHTLLVYKFFQSIFCKDHLRIISSLETTIATLTKKLTGQIDPKEEYYNNKYPKVNLKYNRKETDGQYNIDLRNFFNLNDATIPIVDGDSDDSKAVNGLKWVINNITYTSDDSESTYKAGEYWAYPYQTLKHRAGDCEDMSILLANILIKSGIPYWKVRLMAGDVVGGGHCYVTYYDATNDRWVLLDCCYNANTKNISDRKDYKEEASYKTVWFSWNRDFCFSNEKSLVANDYFKIKKISKGGIK